ncbi:MAG: DUF2244 domain-containing protein [Pseudomonadota bacterium]
MTQPPASEIIYMDAVLTPNASLSPRAFKLLMASMIGVGAAASTFYYTLGAWPVLGFFGLDLIAIYAAFRFIRRQSREETRVRITADAVTMHHRDAKGREKTAQVPSAFARVELEEPVRPTSWLRIEHGQTAYVIGRFLTPTERKSLAKGLRAALQRARAERHPA